jgi:hypothetical protein
MGNVPQVRKRCPFADPCSVLTRHQETRRPNWSALAPTPQGLWKQ